MLLAFGHSYLQSEQHLERLVRARFASNRYFSMGSMVEIDLECVVNWLPCFHSSAGQPKLEGGLCARASTWAPRHCRFQARPYRDGFHQARNRARRGRLLQAACCRNRHHLSSPFIIALKPALATSEAWALSLLPSFVSTYRHVQEIRLRSAGH